MSYIQAFKFNTDSTPSDVLEVHFDPQSCDGLLFIRNLDDEILSFVQDLIGQVDKLDEGEVLVIRKEIY